MPVSFLKFLTYFRQENGMDNDLMNLALLSKPQDMIDVARYAKVTSKIVSLSLSKTVLQYSHRWTFLDGEIYN